MVGKSGALTPNERRRLEAAGFIQEEINALAWNFGDPGLGRIEPIELPYTSEVDPGESALDHPIWQSAMKEHSKLAKVFYDEYYSAHNLNPNVPADVAKAKEAYRQAVLKWQLAHFKSAMPWVWIEAEYEPGVTGYRKKRMMEASEAITQLRHNIKMYFD
jgi:hypothetical protein